MGVKTLKWETFFVLLEIRTSSSKSIASVGFKEFVNLNITQNFSSKYLHYSGSTNILLPPTKHIYIGSVSTFNFPIFLQTL